MIGKRQAKNEPRSILELKGKGKNIWKGLNVKAYIDEEDHLGMDIRFTGKNVGLDTAPPLHFLIAL